MASSKVCLVTAPPDAMSGSELEATQRLAELSFMNGSATEAQKIAAVEAAQHVGITTSQYLHARLLLGAKIPVEHADDL